MKRLGLSLFLLVMVGCIAETPQEPPKRGFYKNEPVTFSASYDDVWLAATTAVEELNWDIKKVDKATGIIELRTSYVYNTSFGKYERVYLEPKNGEFERSKIKPYLREISYYEQDAPPIPEFVRETLNVKVKALSPSETQVKINYEIMPYYDYRIGYLGTVRSNGYVEKRLFKRTQEILTRKGAVETRSLPPRPPAPVIEEEFALKDIFFDFNKSNIRPDAESVLQEDAETLKENPKVSILIEGYGDIRGTDEYNLRLAQRRADATKAFLVKLGVDPSKIEAASRGETSRFAPGNAEEAYQLNRRAHFIPMRPGSIPGARIFFKFNKESKPKL